jgi:hypothetical protein
VALVLILTRALHAEREVGFALLIDLRVKHLVLKVGSGLRLEEHACSGGLDNLVVLARTSWRRQASWPTCTPPERARSLRMSRPGSCRPGGPGTSRPQRPPGDVTAYRHYWELCVLMGLRDGLRSGDVHVPGSRRYADPASFRLSPAQWAPRRLEFCQLTGKPAAAADALALADDELLTTLADLEGQLARGGPGEVRVTAAGELVILPLTAEDIPAEAGTFDPRDWGPWPVPARSQAA